MSKELNKAPVEQAGGDERVIGWRERILAAHPNSDPGFWPDALLVEHMAAEIADLRAALAQPSPKCATCGDTGQIVVSGPHYCGQFQPPEYETEPCDMCAQPSPAQAEQAEAERPPQPERYTADVFHPERPYYMAQTSVVRASDFDEFATQYERIVGALRAVIAQLRQHKNDYMDSGQETYRALQNEIREREAEIARLDGLVSGRTAERDAALARVASLESKLAELEKQDLVDVPGPDEIHQMAFEEGQPADDGDGYLFSAEEFDLFVQRLLDSCAAPVAQAQHSVPDELRAICMLVAETGIKYGCGRHRAVAADECRAVVNAVLNADLSVGRACEYAGCCEKAHPGTSLCIAHHSKKAREQLLAAAPGKEVGHE
ncbi:TPA: hypothetical protein NIE75_005297 [Pseudomonas aeruginosa]|nr:hypothetical protein [Pseudomonas aeruginosa]